MRRSAIHVTSIGRWVARNWKRIAAISVWMALPPPPHTEGDALGDATLLLQGLFDIPASKRPWNKLQVRAAHALEIPYKFDNVQPTTKDATSD